MKQDNEKYCTECGELINIKAEICPKCGVRQQIQSNPISAEITEQRNKWITCLLLCWFLGVFGVHQIYTGHKVSEVESLFLFLKSITKKYNLLLFLKEKNKNLME